MASMRFPEDIVYSKKYTDSLYEYRIVTLNKLAYVHRKKIPSLYLSEAQWRSIGLQQSRGWVHIGGLPEEPHVLSFRRLLGTNPLTGSPPHTK